MNKTKNKHEFKVGDIVKSKANKEFTYEVTEVNGDFLDIKCVTPDWTDTTASFTHYSVFYKVKEEE